jgi:hypothetical protein
MLRYFVVLPLLAGCGSYAVNQAALVPHAEPIPYNGQPQAAPSALSLGAGNAFDLIAPRATAGDVGDAVPATQLRGELALSPRPDLVLGAIYEHGFAATATPLSSSQPPVGSDVDGGGVGIAYSLATSAPGWRVGFAAEALVWNVPWVQYSQCTETCGGAPTATMTTGSDLVPMLAVAMIPSYRFGRWTVFGGVTVRNQPTTYQKGQTTLPGDADVQSGDYNAIASLGAEVLLSGIQLSVILDQGVTADPIRYGPGLSAMVTIPLAERRP